MLNDKMLWLLLVFIFVNKAIRLSLSRKIHCKNIKRVFVLKPFKIYKNMIVLRISFNIRFADSNLFQCYYKFILLNIWRIFVLPVFFFF